MIAREQMAMSESTKAHLDRLKARGRLTATMRRLVDAALANRGRLAVTTGPGKSRGAWRSRGRAGVREMDAIRALISEGVMVVVSDHVEEEAARWGQTKRYHTIMARIA